MNYLADYVRTIALFLLFISLALQLAPSGVFRKYVKLAASLMLTAIVIAPIADIANGESDVLDLFTQKAQGTMNTEGMRISRQSANLYEKEANDVILATYKENLNAATVNIIKTRLNYSAKSVTVTICEDENADNFAAVEKIKVNLDFAIRHEDEKGGIGKLAFGNMKKTMTDDDVRTVMEQNVKILLSDFYNVDAGNIIVM